VFSYEYFLDVLTIIKYGSALEILKEKLHTMSMKCDVLLTESEKEFTARYLYRTTICAAALGERKLFD